MATPHPDEYCARAHRQVSTVAEVSPRIGRRSGREIADRRSTCMEVSDLLTLPHPNDRKPHMHTKLLSRWLADRTVIRHATRAAVLVRAVRALLTGGKLSLTHHTASSCVRFTQSSQKTAARSSLPTLAFEVRGSETSRSTVGTGSAQFETRSSTIACRLGDGALPIRSIQRRPPCRATSARWPCRGDIDITFGSTLSAPTGLVSGDHLAVGPSDPTPPLSSCLSTIG